MTIGASPHQFPQKNRGSSKKAPENINRKATLFDKAPRQICTRHFAPPTFKLKKDRDYFPNLNMRQSVRCCAGKKLNHT